MIGKSAHSDPGQGCTAIAGIVLPRLNLQFARVSNQSILLAATLRRLGTCLEDAPKKVASSHRQQATRVSCCRARIGIDQEQV